MMVYVLQGLCIQKIIITLIALFLSHQEVLVLSFHITPLAEGDECKKQGRRDGDSPGGV